MKFTMQENLNSIYLHTYQMQFNLHARISIHVTDKYDFYRMFVEQPIFIEKKQCRNNIEESKCNEIINKRTKKLVLPFFPTSRQPIRNPFSAQGGNIE